MGLFRSINQSPVLGMFRRLRGPSVEERLADRLAEAEARAKELSRENDSLTSLLMEAKKKTGISQGWGYTSKDMDATKHRKLRNLAESARTSHPIANKALRLRRSFVCQEGFKLVATCEDEQKRERVQAYLDEHWDINWEGRVEARVDTLCTLGELCFWAAPPNTRTGQFEIGGIDSDRITEILTDPLNQERAHKVRFSEPITFLIEDERIQKDELPIVEKCWRTGQYKGQLLYLGINNMSGRHRGISDLAPVIDFLEVFDQLLWTESERVKLLRSLLFQYRMNGASPEAIKKKQAELRQNPPPPGTIVVTNESVELEVLAPNLNTSSSLEIIKYVFGLVAGCLDMPEHFYYSGGDVNRASAREMTDPIYAGVRNRKKELVHLIYTEHAYALQRAAQVETSAVYGFTADELAFEVQSRDPERDAASVIGEHLLTLGNALQLGSVNGWINDDQAGRLFRQEAGGLGLGEIEEPAESIDAEMARVQEKLDIVRNIDGVKENFPLSLNGKREWTYTA